MVWVWRFGVNQILAFVLQFDVGANGVNIQADAGFLQLGGLLVEALRESDAGIGGVAGGEGAEDEEVLVNDGGDDGFASGAFVGARLAGAFAADLVAADQGKIENGLRKSGTGFNDLKGTELLPHGRTLNALNIVLNDRAAAAMPA